LVFGLVIVGLAGQFFRVMSSICFICFVGCAGCSSAFAVKSAQPIEFVEITSRRQAVDAGAPEQFGELLAGIEHPGLHRALGDADDRADLFHRLLVVVDEVDDLAMRRGQFRNAGA